MEKPRSCTIKLKARSKNLVKKERKNLIEIFFLFLCLTKEFFKLPNYFNIFTINMARGKYLTG